MLFFFFLASQLLLFSFISHARLTGSADLELQGVTPLVPVMGLDAEWRPNTDGLALFQVAFRRSVRLGPTTVVLRS